MAIPTEHTHADISALYAVTLAWHYATTKSKAAAKPRAAIY